MSVFAMIDQKSLGGVATTFANSLKETDGVPLTTSDCIQIASAGLVDNYFTPDDLVIGITNGGFCVFEKSRCKIVDVPVSIKTKFEDSMSVIGNWTLRFVFKPDLTFIQIEKGMATVPHNGRFVYNDKAAIDKFLEISKSWGSQN